MHDTALTHHIGRGIRARRRLLELSQGALAAECGVTFQTIHKYECGAVQISAAALFTIARALNVPASYFFEGFPRHPAKRDGQAPSGPHGAAAA